MLDEFLKLMKMMVVEAEGKVERRQDQPTGEEEEGRYQLQKMVPFVSISHFPRLR